jgi:hypothetical protein
MASGHVNRANRPNTWPLRPTRRKVKILLANPEPSAQGPSCHFASMTNLIATGHSGLASRQLPRFMMEWTSRRRRRCAEVEVLSTTQGSPSVSELTERRAFLKPKAGRSTWRNVGA